MRVVQIIDSLETGGAERMAVNYANALSNRITFSGLIATRSEGMLLYNVHEKVSYQFLNKKKRIDIKAIFRLRRYLKENKIDFIHAHSSSFFISVLVKMTLPKIKIIWHDHYGISQDLTLRKDISLKLGSLFFNGIISVNTALKKWAESYLFCPYVVYLPNFIDQSLNSNKKLSLFGSQGKRIVCVANLRPQKNHELLLRAAGLIKNKYPDWTFHLFGKDFNDSHSEKLKKILETSKLQSNVFFYGAVNNVVSALEQSDIAVLTSLSEGLPLAVLEYGLQKLPVVATNVGDISKVITNEKEGIIIEPNNIEELVKSISGLIDNENRRKEMGEELYKAIMSNYGEEVIIREYISQLKSLINFAALREI
ncbi:glycosyltransferase [Flavobacterium ginsengiterrae]|uniref:Glycosyltransferase n=1 Tax=Flavobacterium ginsengiterrae TaxID=871695 RepID=A0ABP7GZW8_9FLAO